jgi:hypothetical protein
MARNPKTQKTYLWVVKLFWLDPQLYIAKTSLVLMVLYEIQLLLSQLCMKNTRS